MTIEKKIMVNSKRISISNQRINPKAINNLIISKSSINMLRKLSSPHSLQFSRKRSYLNNMMTMNQSQHHSSNKFNLNIKRRRNMNKRVALLPLSSTLLIRSNNRITKVIDRYIIKRKESSKHNKISSSIKRKRRIDKMINSIINNSNRLGKKKINKHSSSQKLYISRSRRIKNQLQLLNKYSIKMLQNSRY